MKYISIDKFIDFVSKNKVPVQYYGSRFHKGFIEQLSLEDYVKWQNYLNTKRQEWKKNHKEEHREYCKFRYREDEVYREKHLRYFKNWYVNNKEKVYAGLKRRYWRKKWRERMKTINIKETEEFIVVRQGNDEILLSKNDMTQIEELINDLKKAKDRMKEGAE